MSVMIYTKGLLEPVEVDEEFAGAIQAMNISMAKGNSFVVMDAPDGGHEAFYIPNINRVKEIL